MKDQLRASLNPFDNSIKDGNKELFSMIYTGAAPSQVTVLPSSLGSMKKMTNGALR